MRSWEITSCQCLRLIIAVILFDIGQYRSSAKMGILWATLPHADCRTRLGPGPGPEGLEVRCLVMGQTWNITQHLGPGYGIAYDTLNLQLFIWSTRRHPASGIIAYLLRVGTGALNAVQIRVKHLQIRGVWISPSRTLYLEFVIFRTWHAHISFRRSSCSIIRTCIGTSCIGFRL